MIHEPKIEQIYQELVLLDPSLKQDEQKVKSIISLLLKERPNVVIDENFKTSLLSKLQARVVNYKPEFKLSFNPFKYMFVKRLSIVSSTVALVALFTLAGMIVYNQTGSKKIALSTESLTDVNISPKGSNAFGSLAKLVLASVSQSDKGSAIPTSTEAATGSDFFASVPGGSGGATSVFPIFPDVVLPYPDNISPTFKYTGQKLTQDNEKMDVLRRVERFGKDVDFSAFLNGLQLGIIDTTKLKNLKLENFRVVEDREFGYGFYVDTNQAVISVGQNWEKWPMDQLVPQVRKENYSTDEEILGIAKQFLDDYHVSVENFGEPYVENSWKVYYEKMASTSELYYPEYASVIYPFLINGQLVYDEQGNPTGMSIGVNISYKKVVNADIWSQQYESSSYDAETDFDRIIKFAEQGGLPRQYFMLSSATSTSVLNLDTPRLGLVRYYDYQNNRGELLMVPAYIFPILSKPDKDAEPYFLPSNVVVPLIKNILDNPPFYPPYPVPLPATESLPNP